VWSLAARAQQPAMPVIGFLNSTLPEGFTERLHKFSQCLKEQGFNFDCGTRPRPRTRMRLKRQLPWSPRRQRNLGVSHLRAGWS
jgi:hypothetical protein